jgi:hypothetical protein
MSDAALTDYYVKTLIMEYLDKPKAKATIQVLIDALMIFDLIVDVRDGYNVDDAVGVQLDVLGKYAGIGRNITGFSTSISYFGFLVYGETPPKTGIVSYLTYGATSPTSRYRRYIDTNSTIYSMADAQYRVMVQMGFFKNHSNASLESIDFMMGVIFGTRWELIDNGDMVLRYIFQESDQLTIAIAEFVGLIPKPTGVGLEIDIVPDIAHVFAFKQYGVTPQTDRVGFKIYGVAKAGGMASYG